jgi:branched-chain amino acid transport system substrate-binding protein
MTGSDRALGEDMLRAVNLYANEINEAGGVQGRLVEVVSYDDQNDPELAVTRARDVVLSDALAVIGHRSSSTSIAAGEIYEDAGLVMITGSATANEVTRGNRYAFRTVFNNDTQGDFLARYSYRILAQKSVHIVTDGSVYGNSLADAFSSRFRSVGGRVASYNLLTEGGDAVRTLAQQLVSHAVIADAITAETTTSDDRMESDTLTDVVSSTLSTQAVEETSPPMILLATAAPEAARLVAGVRRLGGRHVIVGGDALGSQAFMDTLNGFVQERRQPGRFSNGIFVASPLLFDVAGERAQGIADAFNATYNDTPSWSSATYYDATKVVSSAAETVDFSVPLAEQREALRQALAAINEPLAALPAATGNLYFDPNGDPVTLVTMGQYQNQRLISAQTQFRMIPQEPFAGLEEALTDGRVLELADRYVYRTQVIYTGLEFLDVEAVDTGQLHASLSFHLWFRYEGALDIDALEFTNAAEPPRFELLEQTSVDDLNYRLYRVSGTFRLGFVPHAFGERVLGVQFRNIEQSNDNVLYVVDVLGLTGGVSSPITETVPAVNPFISRLEDVFGWRVARRAFFQDTFAESSLGNPNYLAQGSVGYSRFNAVLWLMPSGLQVRRRLPVDLARWLTLVSLGVLVISLLPQLLIRVFPKLRHYDVLRGVLWVLGTASSIVLLLASEVVVIDILGRTLPEASASYQTLSTQLYAMLWWLVPALLLLFAIEEFVWVPLEERTGRTVPSVMRGSVAIIVCALAAFGVLSFVFEQPLTGVLATSGVLVMVVGLAVQINIANVFSGLAINMEQPFRVGDWVTIDDVETGQVIDITWRTTRLRTPLGNIISIPNSTASDKVVQNYNYPSQEYWLRYTVHVDPSHPPKQVKALLEQALQQSEGVLAVRVFFTGLSEWSAAFWIDFQLDDFGARFKYADSVWSNVWQALRNAGIKPALRDRQRHLYDEDVVGQPYVLDEPGD